MEPHRAFEYVDCICNGWFTLELLVRFLCCPNKKRFVFSFINIVDCIATLSFYMDLIIILLKLQEANFVEYLDIIRIIRILQLSKLTRHSPGLKILIQTIRASAQELLLLVFFLGLGIVLFASLVYYAERIQENPNNCSQSVVGPSNNDNSWIWGPGSNNRSRNAGWWYLCPWRGYYSSSSSPSNCGKF